MRRLGFVCLALSWAVVAGCDEGVRPGTSTNVDKPTLDPGGDAQPNMNGPSNAPPTASKKRTPAGR